LLPEEGKEKGQCTGMLDAKDKQEKIAMEEI
jgi:hypothetical protein